MYGVGEMYMYDGVCNCRGAVWGRLTNSEGRMRAFAAAFSLLHVSDSYFACSAPQVVRAWPEDTFIDSDGDDDDPKPWDDVADGMNATESALAGSEALAGGSRGGKRKTMTKKRGGSAKRKTKRQQPGKKRGR